MKGEEKTPTVEDGPKTDPKRLEEEEEDLEESFGPKRSIVKDEDEAPTCFPFSMISLRTPKKKGRVNIGDRYFESVYNLKTQTL